MASMNLESHYSFYRYHNWEIAKLASMNYEDFGRLLFVLGISACESVLIVVFLWRIIKFVKKISNNPNN